MNDKRLELSISILEYCQIYPNCKFHLRVNPHKLDSVSARVFNHLFRKTGKLYPGSDYGLLEYITKAKTLDEWIESEYTNIEIDDKFVGQVFDLDGNLFCPLKGYILPDRANNGMRACMIGNAMRDFDLLLRQLNEVANAPMGAAA